MKILITGGLGNLGLWLTEAFLSAGATVHVLGRSEKVNLVHANYTFLKCDITDKKSLCNTITCYYDFCIHAASYNEHFEADYAKKALLINALGTDYICQRLLEVGVGKIIYLSTFHVYGTPRGVVNEKTPIQPNNDYGLTHYFAEKYIEKYNRNSGLKYSILRLTNSYGCPRDIKTNKWYLLLNDLAKNVFETEKIKLSSNGNACRDFIWMGDAVAIIQAVMENDSTNNNIFNLSFGVSRRLFDVAVLVQSAYFQYSGKLIEIEVSDSDLKEYTDFRVSNEKLKSVIEFTPVDKFIEESINIFKMLSTRV